MHYFSCYQADCYNCFTRRTVISWSATQQNLSSLFKGRVRLLALPILRIIVIRIRNQEAREKVLVICRVIASRENKRALHLIHIVLCAIFTFKKEWIWLIQFYPVSSFVCCLWQVNRSASQAIIIVTWDYWIWYNVKYHVSIAYIVQ